MKTRLTLVTALCITVAGAAGAQEFQSRIERAVHVCNACHGEGGISTSPLYPKLAGQQVLYTIEQLKLFRTQKRSDSSPQAYMWGISALLDDETIHGLAEYYAQQKPAAGKAGDVRMMALGKRIFEQGIPSKGIASCASCHGENGEGASIFPRIASQHADYTVRQLQEFKTKLRPHGAVMAQHVVKAMTGEEMRAVATYLQSRP